MERRYKLLDKKRLERILNENNWGIYLKGKPLEEMTTNVGVIYKVCEVASDKLIDEYNETVEE